MTLLERSLWVFDMDGTLTVPAHNFAKFKVDHGLPADKDVLAGTLALPEPRRSSVLQAIRDWEDHIAATATAQPDALRLLDELRDRGATLAVLTRNTKPGATITLSAAGLDGYFPEDSLVLGRDCAPAKPEPDGVQLLMRRAGSTPEQTVMVGDWVFDVIAGKRAGAASVLVERHGPSPADWAPHCDHVVASLDELLA